MTLSQDFPDRRPRCRWCAAAPEFLAYHDREWGFPVAADRRLFVPLSLETAQSGYTGEASRPSARRFETPYTTLMEKRGGTFVGPTTVHGVLQAMGPINHHAEGCAIRAEAAAARAAFRVPTR